MAPIAKLLLRQIRRMGFDPGQSFIACRQLAFELLRLHRIQDLTHCRTGLPA